MSTTTKEFIRGPISAPLKAPTKEGTFRPNSSPRTRPLGSPDPYGTWSPVKKKSK